MERATSLGTKRPSFRLGSVCLARYPNLLALLQRRGNVVIAVFLDQAHQFGAVELVRVHALQCPGAAPLPMLDQIAEELAGPADAAVEKCRIGGQSSGTPAL